VRLYSQMTLAELQEEMEKLRILAAEAQKAGDESRLAVIRQKYFIAKSYYLGTEEYRIGGKYSVPDHDQPFTIEYFNGVFAWGRFPDSHEQVAFPVGMLEPWSGT